MTITAKIVFADNDEDFIETRSEYLERVGIEVIPATSLSEAREALALPGIHLAILDVRLEDNRDDKDVTGMLLAAEEAFLSVPKIILTGYGKEEHVMLKIGGKLPRYLAYVHKSDGPQAMIAAIIKALATVAPRFQAGGSGSPPLPQNRKVFIVHGHDVEARQSTELLLRRLKLKPVILSEQADGGKTVIEAFECHSEVSFAIAVLTPDDFGGVKTAPADSVDPRRQNVLFDMSYFIGKLGRERVCALLKGGVEVPPDLHGVRYIEMDAPGAWHRRVFDELREAGFPVDPDDL